MLGGLTSSGYGLAKDILGKAGLGKIIGLRTSAVAGKTGEGGSVQTQAARLEDNALLRDKSAFQSAICEFLGQ